MARSIRIESIGGGSRGAGGATGGGSRRSDGLTAKEIKIVLKRSRRFDSNTEGIGLPKKSSRETITGRKPGKPKSNAGKGVNKNIITTGKSKSIVRNTKVKGSMEPINKGKNKNWSKEANKLTTPGNSRRAKIKKSSINTGLEKHPLVRNAGEASSETKYRVMRGKSVPVKKKKQ